ncbi:spore coat protein YsxE [Metabacillus arenae]|uniref:Spore coat protein YsxE n=1 Tax=Metabacillus arenae TaxID=2771434 RepID=A0A926NHK1_9BACI|nr:spore coat protein YsxE [Metabacillus arenae]MBD1381190.1 spore coat protein YsxE [Metabacillus arenae]
MAKELTEKIRAIVSHYGLDIEYVEVISKKVYKVYTAQGSFALKELSSARNQRFFETYENLYKSNYQSFVPIFSTKEQHPIVTDGEKQYYLMPWYLPFQDEERDERHKYLFKEAAELHKKTIKEIPLNKEETRIYYEKTKQLWNENKMNYEKFVDKSEKKWYVSPFELQALTYYIEASRATDFALEKLDEWFEAVKDLEETRIVYIHGRLSAHHFLYDDEGTGHFINFEQAAYAPPINDLLLFYFRTLNSYPVTCNECVDWFYTYSANFPLKEEEKNLFLSYLAYPNSIYKVVQSYQKKNRSKKSQLEETKEITKAYWQFKNIEHLVMTISDIEARKKAEQEAAES